jgi:hypothetical protein
MILQLARKWFTDQCTQGELYVDGVFECFTLEDVVREGPKIPGRTAIPEGTYQLVVDFSGRFQKHMPHILNVPGFEGIRIHAGNTAEDTEGCILVGQLRGNDSIGQSRAAFDLLFAKIRTALKSQMNMSITISSEEL